MHIYPWQIDPTPQSIEHNCLEYHYTKLGRSTTQLSTDAWNTATPNLADLMADLLADQPPSQLSRDALNTTTPKMSDLLADLPPSQSSIDAFNTATPNLADLMADLPPSIEHRCLEYCYTKRGRSNPRELLLTKDLLPVRVTI